MPDPESELIQMLLARLERVPADSVWAHRASGLRGAMLEALDEAGFRDSAQLNRLTRQAFQILKGAATESGRAARSSWRYALPR